MSTTGRYDPSHIAESIQQIFGTNFLERPMESEIYTSVTPLLYEPNDISLQQVLKNRIVSDLERLEKRVDCKAEDISFEVEEVEGIQNPKIGLLNIGVEDTKAGGFLQRHVPHGDGAGSVVRFVISHHSGVVHLVDVVTGEDHHIVGVKTLDEIDILINGVGSALVPAGLLVVALVGGQHLGAAMGLVQAPGLAVADVLVQLQRLILGQNTDGVNTGIDTVGQGEVDDAVLAAEGNRRLSGLPGQDMQAAALATGQQHCNYAFFLKIHGHSSLYKLMDAKIWGALQP
mgnify:CR=1 FL=1